MSLLMSSSVDSTDPARNQLLKRRIPHMMLGTGQDGSPTAPPKLEANNDDPSQNASARFAVQGNAIVTGGTGALGLAACHALLEHGLSGLAVFDIDTDRSRCHISSLQERFPSRRIIVLQADVTDEVAVSKAVEDVANNLGSIDHLLCFSGIVGCVNALDMPTSQWRRIMDVNTTGSFVCAQAAARQMIAQGTGGSIVFTASISAHRVNYPQPQAAYNVSKSALVTLKNCLAAEWAGFGIRTNTVSPGYMDTVLNEGEGIAEARKIWAARNPTGRMGTPYELTGAIVLLSSSSSSYINGCDIVVDGGGMAF